MDTIEIKENGLQIVIGIDSDKRVRLLHFSCNEIELSLLNKQVESKYYNIIEMQGSGFDIDDHHGSRYTNTSPGCLFKYHSHTIFKRKEGSKLEIILKYEQLIITVHYQLYSAIQIIRSWVDVTNNSEKEFSLEYLASFVYYGLSKDGNEDWSKDSNLYIPHNTWHGELQWRKNKVSELGLSKLNASSIKRLHYEQVGTWSSSEILPIAMYENETAGTTMFWQIEHNGSWYWECSDVNGGSLYLELGGPNNNQHHFRKVLGKGEKFTTVPISVGVVTNGFEGAVGELTKYRRIMRRDHKDYSELKVIFNDYMNCLMGDPSTAKEIPLIDKAAEIGMEYFVIDAGWYTDLFGGDADWWPTVGEWKESKRRFPNGFKEVTDYIIKKGMIPGLWLEIEVIGINCPIINEIPKEWLFQRNGYPVIDHQRYQLDFRNEEVREFASKTVNRLIKDYSLGYIKIDYNINAGIGTDYMADSPGEGLLEHNRAYLKWVKSILDTHPGLVLENCGSGGQRMDYAMLECHQIQSTSDQTDYRQYCSISAMAGSAVTPEQGAVWSYPHCKGNEEATIFNMVNTFLGRIHQSGFLNDLDINNFNLVKEGIDYYKTFRKDIPNALPIFPLGLIRFDSPWACGGLKTNNKIYLSVWRKESDNDTINIPLPFLKNKDVSVKIGYPKGYDVDYTYDNEKCVLCLKLDGKNTARFFEIAIK